MARHLILACAIVAVVFTVAGSPRSDAANPYVMQVDMHGDQVIPAVNSVGWGFLRFFFGPDRLSADYTVDVKGFSGSIVLGADIRRGFRGSNGPIIRHLADGGFITMGNHINFSPAELDDMAHGDWYVTVYTSLHPEGEMRGQIILPADFRPAPTPSPIVVDANGFTRVTIDGKDYLVPPGASLASILPATPGVAVVPGAQPVPGRVEIAPPPGPLPGSVPDAPVVQVTAPQVSEQPSLPPAAVTEDQVSPPPPNVAALAPNVIISPPNTGNGGLATIDQSALTAALVGISTLIFGVGLMVLSGRI